MVFETKYEDVGVACRKLCRATNDLYLQRYEYFIFKQMLKV